MFGDLAFTLNWDTRQKYFVRVKDGKEPHFKTSVRSFDKEAEIKSLDDGFELITNMDEVDITCLTSVKSLKRI